MRVSRRHFIALSAAIAASCDRKRLASSATAPATSPSTSPSAPEAVVDAGPLSAYSEDRIYDALRDQGVFIIRRDKKVFALSAVCTHKGCKVRGQKDGSFACRCHGSTFDADGHVTRGPARRDLPRLPIATDRNNHVLVGLHT